MVVGEPSPIISFTLRLDSFVLDFISGVQSMSSRTRELSWFISGVDFKIRLSGVMELSELMSNCYMSNDSWSASLHCHIARVYNNVEPYGFIEPSEVVDKQEESHTSHRCCR